MPPPLFPSIPGQRAQTTTQVGELFKLSGDAVRAVSQTTAGATGGSVKMVGGTVKGLAKAVESVGDSTSASALPGGFLVGGMIHVVGRAARGIGDAVVVLGGVTEEIAAETGKVVAPLSHGLSRSFLGSPVPPSPDSRAHSFYQLYCPT